MGNTRSLHAAITALVVLPIATQLNADKPDAVESPHSDGPLVIVGGAEDGKGEILREFVRLAGGDQARLVVIPVASQEAESAGAGYVKRFLELGAASVDVLGVSTREDANQPKLIESLKMATGVFFTGGDQIRITSRLRGTELHRFLEERLKNGVVVGGTSAGAAMMSRRMIARGKGYAVPAKDVVEVEKGMTFVEGALIDQHFSQRGRLGRLLAALSTQPDTIGIGIDENTALIVADDEFRVLGDGAVTLLDSSHSTRLVNGSEKSAAIALYDVRLHVIPAGFTFHFEHGAPVPGGRGEGRPIGSK